MWSGRRPEAAESRTAQSLRSIGRLVVLKSSNHSPLASEIVPPGLVSHSVITRSPGCWARAVPQTRTRTTTDARSTKSRGRESNENVEGIRMDAKGEEAREPRAGPGAPGNNCTGTLRARADSAQRDPGLSAPTQTRPPTGHQNPLTPRPPGGDCGGLVTQDEDMCSGEPVRGFPPAGQGRQVRRRAAATGSLAIRSALPQGWASSSSPTPR